MELDDFVVILGDKFLVAAKTTLLPFLGVLLILDKKQPCYVPVRCGAGNSKTSKGKEPMALAMQVKHGLRKDERTYLATLIEMKQDKYVEVSDAMAGLLREFTDVMPLELPKTFPPWRAVDHRIELVPR